MCLFQLVCFPGKATLLAVRTYLRFYFPDYFEAFMCHLSLNPGRVWPFSGLLLLSLCSGSFVHMWETGLA